MTREASSLPWTRRLTAEEYLELETPDDGRRYELIDGVLVVSPSPFVPHQRLSIELAAALHRACPPDLRVFTAPLDVRLLDDTVVQPDVLVVRAEDARRDRLTGVPLLAVEILSESSRATDLLLKRERCERAGVGSYWVSDPRTGETVVWELDIAAAGPRQAGGGNGPRYVEVATGRLYDEPLLVRRPFPVSLRVAR